MRKVKMKKPEISLLRKVKQGELRGKTALVRLDFNTQDEWRMRATLPTLQFLLKQGARVVVVSHRGRPDLSLRGAKQRSNLKKLTLRRDALQLKKWLSCPITFIPYSSFSKGGGRRPEDFQEIRKKIANAAAGSIFLLENIRFLRGEATKRPELAKKLASLADVYVNDAFAVDHHPADSVVGIERFLPSYAGLELENELEKLGVVMTKAKKPLVVVVGGSKAHDKLGILKRFERYAAAFLLGGAAANTLLKLSGFDVKQSLVDTDPQDLRELQRFLFSSPPKVGGARGGMNRKVILPVDCRVSKDRILDIGPKTQKLFAQKLKGARTIIWSGPMGLIEQKPYDQGTLAVARAIAANRKAFSVTGGGETVVFLRKHKLEKKFSFISTGGGAMLDFLAGKKLPGIEALKTSKK